MKTQPSHQSSDQGSALVITMVLGVILLVIVGSYLQLLGTQKNLVLRSESWNASLTMAEAGVEEALAQLNSGVTSLSANGWGGAGSVFGPVARRLEGGSYSVIISNSSATKPVIYATGFASVPVSGDSISRKVKINVLKQVFSNVPLGAKKDINMNGSGAAVDSYDSSNPLLSTGGVFDPNKLSTNGNVVSMGGVVNTGNHIIKGNLYLGPTATYSGSTANVTGTIYKDANIDFPDATLPEVTWQTAPLYLGIHSFTNSGYYTVSDQYPVVVQPGVTVTLNVVTAVTYSPVSVQITGGITNSGAANIYLNGPPNLKLSGSTTFNDSNRPQNLRFFGLPSLTSVSLDGNAEFVGIIYTPEADVSLNGGGSNSGLIGSLVCNSIKLNGGYQIHYDESLATNGPAIYVIQSWQEL